MSVVKLSRHIMENVRSLSSIERAYVRFINETDRKVEVIWVNYDGRFVKHILSRKGDFIDVNTFKSHPWIAVDSDTKDRLQLDEKFVYHPKTTKELFSERYPGRELPFNFEARVRVKITLPLLSLRRLALLEIRNHLQTVEQLDTLELPRGLKEDLRKLIVHRNRTKSLYM